MSVQIKRAFWTVSLIIMSIAFNVAFVFAQDEVETAASEGPELAGPMIFVLLLGFAAIVAIGGAIFSQQSAEESNA